MFKGAKARPFSIPAPALAFGLLLSTGAWSGAVAQSPRDRILVTVDWLARHLDDANLVLLQVGDPDEYAAEHIPGAHFIDLDMISAPEDHEHMTGLNLQMPEPRALARTLGEMGISDDSRIVVYPGNDWVTPSARVIMTLDWIGLGDRASLLDGGMQLWKAQGHPVTGEATPTSSPGVVTPRVKEGLVVSAEWVRDHLDTDGFAIVDARAPVHYQGIQATNLHGQPVRKGHIPGAVNVPINGLVNEDLTFKSPTELQEVFTGAGVRPGDTIVGYCHLGQYATFMLFGARTLGYSVKLYDGSFQEWGSREDLPVEGGGG